MDAGRGGLVGGPQPKHHKSDVDRQPNQHCGNHKMDHGQTLAAESGSTSRGCFGSVLQDEKLQGVRREVLPPWRTKKAVVRDELFPGLTLLAGLRLQRKAKPQGHALDRIRRASENFRRLFQWSRRLGQLHEPAVFLKRPGLARHNRNDPLVDTTTKPPSDPCSLDGFAWVGPGLGSPVRRWICDRLDFATNNAD